MVRCLVIGHRGNIANANLDRENSPEYIYEALNNMNESIKISTLPSFRKVSLK